MGTKGKFFIVAAPSGAGKTTLVNEICSRLEKDYRINRVVTYTSRPRRPSEKDGRDYFFISAEDFQRKRDANFFLETTTYDNHLYGSPSSLIEGLNKGNSYIITTDRPGSRLFKQLFPTATLIWITVPDINVLADRLIKRNAHDEQKIKDRLLLAQQEIEEEKAHPFFEHYVLNDNFEEAVKELTKIIVEQLLGNKKG